MIESYARRFRYGVVRDFTGHGIGTTFHSGLIVPHFDDPAVSVIMEPGMTFTIEPMLTLGTIEYDIWPDGWTVVTKDRKRTAQFEHTVLVTAGRLRDPHLPLSTLAGTRRPGMIVPMGELILLRHGETEWSRDRPPHRPDRCAAHPRG